MADVEYTPVTGATPLQATELNSRFNSVETAINEVVADHIERAALMREHFSGGCILPGVGTTELAPAAVASFTNQYPTWAVYTNGAAGGGTAQVTWPALNGVPILVLANLHVISLTETSVAAIETAFRVMARIAWLNGAGTWTGLDRSIRSLSQEDVSLLRFDIPIRALLLPSDLGGSDITGVRLEVCTCDALGRAIYTFSTDLSEANITAIPMKAEAF